MLPLQPCLSDRFETLTVVAVEQPSDYAPAPPVMVVGTDNMLCRRYANCLERGFAFCFLLFAFKFKFKPFC